MRYFKIIPFLSLCVLSQAQENQSPSVRSATLSELGEPLGSSSRTTGISADGSVVVGKLKVDGVFRAILWNGQAATAGLSHPDGYAYGGGGYPDISADGSTVTYEYGSTSNGAARAFRWTEQTGMRDLGTLGGDFSYASGISRDGSVVVGQSRRGDLINRAFRWTEQMGMRDIGSLHGSSGYSSATGVSADGNVVFGESYGLTGETLAFRWTEGLGMKSLGSLGAGSYATHASADGSVIAGYSGTGLGKTEAFRWTELTGIVGLGTLGGSYSSINGISSDGFVVVGQSELTRTDPAKVAAMRAYRWTAAGMVDLGTLGGAGESNATGVSADGSVVIGHSNSRAFIWTELNGMEDLGTLGGDFTSYYAGSVSADGSVIVGTALTSGGASHAFIYRGRKLLDADAWLASVGGNSRIYHDGTTLASLPLEGAHHRPMLSFDRMGKEHQAWAAGDFGSSSRTRDIHVTTGEAGLNWNVGKTGLIGFAAGHGIKNADLAHDGSSSTRGDYALVEFDYRPEGKQWIVSLLGMVGSWGSKINRGYITGAGTDFSFGTTDIITRTARLRVDASSLVTFCGFGFAPFASCAVTQTTVSAYAETGGSFPASFEEQSHDAQEGRIGFTAAKDLSAATKLLFTIEAIRRFDGAGPALVGQEFVGGIAFNQPGAAPSKDCVRFGVDVDYKLSADTLLNLSVQAATVGEVQDIAGAISLRRAF
jgi:probable HAF family extracellular repeat protein